MTKPISLTDLRIVALDHAVKAMSTRVGIPSELTSDIVSAAEAFYAFLEGDR